MEGCSAAFRFLTLRWGRKDNKQNFSHVLSPAAENSLPITNTNKVRLHVIITVTEYLIVKSCHYFV